MHGVPAELALALPPRRHSPAAHDQLHSEARRLGHTGEVLQLPPGEVTAWVAAGRAWTLLPAGPEHTARVADGVRLVPAPERLRLHARLVARTEDPAILEAEQVVTALATPDGGAA